MTVGSDNGYHGGLDTTPWFTNVFILDKIEVKEDVLEPLDNLYKLIFNLRRVGNSVQANIVRAVADFIRSFNKK